MEKGGNSSQFGIRASDIPVCVRDRPHSKRGPHRTLQCPAAHHKFFPTEAKHPKIDFSALQRCLALSGALCGTVDHDSTQTVSGRDGVGVLVRILLVDVS